jgi:hypothetical protein
MVSLVGWRECPEPRHPWDVRRVWAFMVAECSRVEENGILHCWLQKIHEIYLAPSAAVRARILRDRDGTSYDKPKSHGAI